MEQVFNGFLFGGGFMIFVKILEILEGKWNEAKWRKESMEQWKKSAMQWREKYEDLKGS